MTSIKKTVPSGVRGAKAISSLAILLCAVFLFPAIVSAASPETLLKKAELGDAEAQVNLGLMYYIGKEVPQNYQIAYQWLSKAAEKRVAKAEYYLGRMHAAGNGLP